MGAFKTTTDTAGAALNTVFTQKLESPNQSTSTKPNPMKTNIIARVLFVTATFIFGSLLEPKAFAVGPHATVVTQNRADTGASIPYTTGTIPTGVGVYFEANVTSDEGRTVRMDCELRQLPATFTGTPNYSSSLVAGGTRARTSTATGMAAGNWGWKYRFVDSVGVSTGWLPAGNPDFIVQASTTVPTVQTVGATGTATTSATINGTITSDGGSSIIDRRFDWGTSSGNLNQAVLSVNVSGNSFSYTLTGLSPNTTYYFRAWARNGSSANVGYGTGWNIGSILSFTTSASCSYSFSPTSVNPSSSSGSGSFSMTAGSGCSWSASTAYSWIHTSSSGSGNGTVSYSYDANTSTSSRSGTITAGGQTLTITQSGTSSAVDFPGATWIPAGVNHFTTASRGQADVTSIVVHTTEDAFYGAAIAWFQNTTDPSANTSAHYLVQRNGSVVQLVREKDIAHHAGVWLWNQHSIGIEVERLANGTEIIETAQYNSVKNLVDSIRTRFNVPLVFPATSPLASPTVVVDGIVGHGKAVANGIDPVNWNWAYFQQLFNSSCSYAISPSSISPSSGSGSGSFSMTAVADAIGSRALFLVGFTRPVAALVMGSLATPLMPTLAPVPAPEQSRLADKHLPSRKPER